MNAPTTPAAVLKKATAAAHLSAEKALIRHVQRMDTADGYARLLSCLYGYFAPMEQRLEAYLPAALPDYAQRRKASRILDDLRALGHPLPQAYCNDLPLISDDVEALAGFYVLEGSVLGGAVLKRLISAQCPGVPKVSFSFFAGYGEENGAMWRTFLDRFNDAIDTEAYTEKAVAAANVCFAKLEAWIRTCYKDPA